MKGIVLAGGTGSRLFPLTFAVSKQLLPVFDKPMIYYSLAVQMFAGIRDILIISTPRDLPIYEQLLGDGSSLGISISYLEQLEPRGLPEAFILGETFLGLDSVCLVLGDNIFHGQGLTEKLLKAKSCLNYATIFCSRVADPERFGVAVLGADDEVLSLEEKPSAPLSNLAVTGLYMYGNDVIEIAKSITPSRRGELEITDLNNKYLTEGRLRAEVFGRGFTWMDSGTHQALSDASNLIQTIQTRQGVLVGCLEEIAFNSGWIDECTLEDCITRYGNSHYGKYLQNLLKD